MRQILSLTAFLAAFSLSIGSVSLSRSELYLKKNIKPATSDYVLRKLQVLPQQKSKLTDFPKNVCYKRGPFGLGRYEVKPIEFEQNLERNRGFVSSNYEAQPETQLPVIEIESICEYRNYDDYFRTCGMGTYVKETKQESKKAKQKELKSVPKETFKMYFDTKPEFLVVSKNGVLKHTF